MCTKANGCHYVLTFFVFCLFGRKVGGGGLFFLYILQVAERELTEDTITFNRGKKFRYPKFFSNVGVVI